MNHIDHKTGNLSINLKIEKITARPRKLTAKWTTEAAEDFRKIFGELVACPSCNGTQSWDYDFEAKAYIRNGSSQWDTCPCPISRVPSFPPTVLDVILAAVEDDDGGAGESIPGSSVVSPTADTDRDVRSPDEAESA